MTLCVNVQVWKLPELKEQLHGRIYFNPLEGNYEIADKFLAGNVVHKAALIKSHLEDNDSDFADIDLLESKESFKALQQVIPTIIPFEQLDFNLGERWIPTGIYEKYASYLFDTDVMVHYLSNMDDFSVKADRP